MNFPYYPEALAPPRYDLDDLAGPIHPDHRILPLDVGYPLRRIFETAIEQFGYDPNHLFKIVRYDSMRVDPGTPEGRAALAAEIAEMDHRTHMEAKSIPGYICYSPGEVDEFGFATSWCGWGSWEAAYEARFLPEHKEAMTRKKDFHQVVNFGRYVLRLDNSRPTGVRINQLHNHARPASYANAGRR
jgi:hypothetical protein